MSFFDLHWITRGLAVGARYPMEHAGELARAHQVRSVVDVRQEACDDEAELRRHGMELLHLPTIDMTGVALGHLDEGVAWIRERLERDERVFIHCEHGIGRSAMVGLCVLIDAGQSPLEALRLMKERRPVISLSALQQERFVEWCRRQHVRTNAGWEVPEVMDVREIVWGGR